MTEQAALRHRECVMRIGTTIGMLMVLLILAAEPIEASTTIRFATFNASLYRHSEGELISDLETGADSQAMVIAEIIQRVQPDILLINEFDYDPSGDAANAFRSLYLQISQNGAPAADYFNFVFVAPSNTGIPSGFDLDNNGDTDGLGDAFGYGEFEGQYGMVLYSRYPIVELEVRTFQHFLWQDMPSALLPDDLCTLKPSDWYSDEELDALRLSSKNHWDVPIQIGNTVIHVLASHPTPPVFDGNEDANGRRNHDEIRFWADYVTPGRGDYIYDDAGLTQPLGGQYFVIMGDLNADPLDGDSTDKAVLQLLECPMINTFMTPTSEGGLEQTELQAAVNNSHLGDPRCDTADFGESMNENLRVDYVLPSATLEMIDAGVFWPIADEPLFNQLVGVYPFPGSDHRLVWVDILLP